MWCIYIMEYYSALKGGVKCVPPWMDLGDVMLSERSLDTKGPQIVWLYVFTDFPAKVDGWFPGDREGRVGSDFPGVGFLPEIRSWRWLCSTGNIARFKMVNFVLCDYYLTANCRKSPESTWEEVFSEYAAKKLGKKDFTGLSVTKVFFSGIYNV